MSRVKITKITDYKKDIREIIFGLDFKINQGERILIKPNLVMPRRADSGVTTNLELISALIEIVKENRAIPILGEGAGYEFDSQTFSILGIDKLIKKHNIEFVDFRNCTTIFKKFKNSFFSKIELPEVLQRVDKIINVPKLKTHMLTGISCGMKNLIGMLPLSERRKMHVRGLDKSIVGLNLIIPTDITIVDASVIMHGQGPAFGDKIELGYLLGGTNVFAVDFVAAKFLNVNPLKISYLKIAQDKNLIPDSLENKQIIDGFSATIPENKLYIFIYWLVYLADYLQGKLTKKTFIPWLHWHFGTKPKLEIKRCNLFPDCQKCIKVCPINAINKKHGINFNKCAKVRCLKCFEICPHQAITIKGISKPLNNNQY